MMERINIDDDIEDADWTKTHWPCGKNLQAALTVILSNGPADTPKENVARFMACPVAKYMPDNVREALQRRGLLAAGA